MTNECTCPTYSKSLRCSVHGMGSGIVGTPEQIVSHAIQEHKQAALELVEIENKALREKLALARGTLQYLQTYNITATANAVIHHTLKAIGE